MAAIVGVAGTAGTTPFTGTGNEDLSDAIDARVVLAQHTGHKLLHRLHTTDNDGRCAHCSFLTGGAVPAPCPTMVAAALPADCCRDVT